LAEISFFSRTNLFFFVDDVVLFFDDIIPSFLPTNSSVALFRKTNAFSINDYNVAFCLDDATPLVRLPTVSLFSFIFCTLSFVSRRDRSLLASVSSHFLALVDRLFAIPHCLLQNIIRTTLTPFFHSTCIALLQGHTALVCQLQLVPSAPAISSDNHTSTPDTEGLLVTGGSDGRVITFSLRTFLAVHRLAAHDASVTALQLDAHARWLVTGGTDGRVRLWEGSTGRYVREMWGSGAPGGGGENARGHSNSSGGVGPGDCVWKVAFTGGRGRDGWGGGGATCAIMGRRAGKTVMEIWSFRPREGEV
jgi:WD40 repeat protein